MTTGDEINEDLPTIAEDLVVTKYKMAAEIVHSKRFTISHLHCRFSFILLNCRGSQGNDGRVQTRMFHSRSLYFGRQEAHRGNWESVQEGQKDCQR